MIFDSFRIKNVEFKNRVLRSSMGGRTSYYDGTVSPAWRHFEKKFAQTGVAGIISATIDIDDKRLSPLEYPKLSDNRFIGPLREGVKAVQQTGTRYIIQIGDPGGQTQTSLFSPGRGRQISLVQFRPLIRLSQSQDRDDRRRGGKRGRGNSLRRQGACATPAAMGSRSRPPKAI